MLKSYLGATMALHKEEKRLCRELGNPYGLSISLANQALLLSRKPGHTKEARLLADEALTLAMRHGYQTLIAQFRRFRDFISSSEQ